MSKLLLKAEDVAALTDAEISKRIADVPHEEDYAATIALLREWITRGLDA